MKRLMTSTGSQMSCSSASTSSPREEDVADELLPLLLIRLAVTMRMVAYAATVAKPSGGGLKLDLDRFRRYIEDLIRETKKDADRFIAQARESMTADELGEDES